MISTYKVGDHIIINSGDTEKQFKIVECGNNYIRILDTFTQIKSKRKITELDELVVLGTAIIKPQAPAESRVSGIDAKDFASFSEKEKQKARDKYAFVNGILERDIASRSKDVIDPIIDEIWSGQDDPFATIKKRPHARTVQRWISSYIEANNSIRGLLPLDSHKGNYKTKVVPEVDQHIVTAIAYFKSLEKPSIASSYDHLETLVEFDNGKIDEPSKKRKVPSLPAFIKRLEKEAPKQLKLAREGKEAANIAFKQAKLPQEISLILQRVEADHTQLDLFIVDEKSDLILGRPYITSILDYKSKSVLGFYVGFEKPSYLSIARALRHAILPKTYVKELYPEVVNEYDCYGFPKVLVTDRGKDFESIALQDACMDLNIRIQKNPGRHGWYKGSIERHFRTINDELLSDKQGKVFPNILDTNAYKPEKHAIITMTLFMKIFHKWIIDVYHQKKVSKGRIIPSVSWAEDLDKVPRRVIHKDALNIVLSESKKLKNTKDGIRFDYIDYDNQALTNLRARRGFEKTLFKYDRENLGQIQVFDPDENKFFEVKALNQKYAQKLSLHQHKVIKTFHKKFIQGKVDTEALAVAKMQIMDMVREHIESRKNKSVAASAAVARVLDIGQQSDNTVKDSVHDEIDKQAPQNKPTQHNKSNEASKSSASTDSIKTYDGKNNKMRKKLEF
ncbi:transposase family protein [Alteromonas sp. 5E99-2]|uniref:Mu transposase C-terminal domain-containing protein n=1 Tax=Alteromonas sp. 5E99-2 TaxID=2817683 RepID=UPI001A97D3E6|nr:Mu transposase C-terminal domain-containing protein [Alteromonas sp. 5E99-2]MBO1256691.1 transposase family protein [Alteromonas sp. 5E99-2]